MNRRLSFFAAGVILCVSGCSLAPEYMQPAASIPATLPQGAAFHCPSVAPDGAALKHREFFADPRLQQIIEIALENNRDLRLATLNVERSRAMYGISRAELLPSVDLTASGSRQRIPADLSSSGKSTTSARYGVNMGVAAWELDLFGRIRSLKDQALAAYFASAEAQRGAHIALEAEVGRVYLTLAADREKLKLAQSTLDSQQQTYALVYKLLDAGVGTELDVRRAQVAVETARVAVAGYTQRVAQDHNALNLLAGTSLKQELLPVDLTTVIAPEAICAGLSSAVLLQRPDVVAAEYRLKGAYALIGAARAAFFPRIALTTGIGTASSHLCGLFDAGSGTWNFAPQIVMPIFDARIWAAYRISKAEREMVVTQYDKTIQTAFREVADAMAVQGTIDEQVAAQQALVDSAGAIYNLAQTRYQNGVDNYLSVLAAQQSHFAAEQGLVSLRLAKLANRVRFYAVLGGGGE